MPPIDRVQQLTRVDEYWTMVRRTFVDILKQQHPRKVDDFRQRLQTRPQEEQLLVYHQEPLAIATALASVPVNDAVLRQYLQLVDRMNWRP